MWAELGAERVRTIEGLRPVAETDVEVLKMPF